MEEKIFEKKFLMVFLKKKFKLKKKNKTNENFF